MPKGQHRGDYAARLWLLWKIIMSWEIFRGQCSWLCDLWTALNVIIEDKAIFRAKYWGAPRLQRRQMALLAELCMTRVPPFPPSQT